MTTTYHTPIATGAPANASTINTPLGQLDAAIDLIAGGGVSGMSALILTETSTPSDPAAGTRKVYVKTDGRLYTLDSSSNEVLLVEYPTRLLHFHRHSNVITGNAITTYVQPAEYFNFVAAQVPGDDGDTFEFSGLLEAGTYSMIITGQTDNASGIIDWYLDGVAIDTAQDWYSAGFTLLVEQTVSSIVIASGGNHVFRGVVNGKNGSSSGYAITLSDIIVRQATG